MTFICCDKYLPKPGAREEEKLKKVSATDMAIVLSMPVNKMLQKAAYKAAFE